jgi:hypothetical protein
MKASFRLLLALGLMSPALLLAQKDPSSSADVIGRDLNLKGFGWIGHVGLWTGASVLEVLDKPEAIQLNTLKSFKDATKYWGAKYFSDLKPADAAKIIQTGLGQKAIGASYTSTTALTSPGRIDTVTSTKYDPKTKKYIPVVEQKVIKGKFRCDTFVVYCYSSAGRLSSPWSTPGIVYSNLPKTR